MTTNGSPPKRPPPPFVADKYRATDPVTGPELAAAIAATPDVRPFLVEGLILQQSITLVSSEPGIGKSCILLMIATQGSVGLPIFGDLEVPRPLTTYVFCPERPALELKERCRKIAATIPYDVNRIIFDDGMTGLVDLDNDFSKQAIYHAIDRKAPHGIDIFAVEGLYGMTRKPLASEETANMIYRFNAELIRNYGCSIYYNNHNTKIRYDNSGTALPPNPFGSQFLMANATGAFIFSRLPGPNMSQLKQAKDTVSDLLNELTLTFDHETFTMSSLGQNSSLGRKEKLRRFLNACHHAGKLCSYDDLHKASDLGNDCIKRYIFPWVHDGRITNTKPNGVKALFKILAPV